MHFCATTLGIIVTIAAPMIATRTALEVRILGTCESIWKWSAPRSGCAYLKSQTSVRNIMTTSVSNAGLVRCLRRDRSFWVLQQTVNTRLSTEYWRVFSVNRSWSFSVNRNWSFSVNRNWSFSVDRNSWSWFALGQHFTPALTQFSLVGVHFCATEIHKKC